MHKKAIGKLLLGTKCAQPVRESMNNKWVHYPQFIQNLWTGYIHSVTISPLTQLFLLLSHSISTELCAPKIRDITDKRPYFSTLSTLPITTTTIYI